MKKFLFLILFIISINLGIKSQPCTSTVYYDNMETFTWFGDWFTYSFSNFFTNFSVSPSVSAVHYGSGNGSSGIEQDWYVLPQITGLNPNYTYKVKFRLASYTVTAPTATTRGLDAGDYLQVQLSRNGGAYVAEMTILGFNNQTWAYSATGVASKTANGTNTNYQITAGGARTDAYSTVELTLQPNTTSVAIDLYTRCNSAGEEFWIDNIELIEVISNPSPVIFGDSIVCAGDTVTLTAVGGNSFSWSGGISNGIGFVPSVTASYTVTATFNGMTNGNGVFNTCASVQSKMIMVDENCILPIYLTSFDGDNIKRNNHLYWITEQEINSSHFEIERSKDGINFNKIGSVDAININPYEFVDESAFIGYNYYRLKMIDLDESYSYSHTIALFADYGVETQIYPNPFENSITYTYYSEDVEELEIFIFNTIGQIIHHEIIKCETCTNTAHINVNDIPPGTYRLYVKHKKSGHETNQTIIKK